jgi:hypothetical protein
MQTCTELRVDFLFTKKLPYAREGQQRNILTKCSSIARVTEAIPHPIDIDMHVDVLHAQVHVCVNHECLGM